MTLLEQAAVLPWSQPVLVFIAGIEAAAQLRKLHPLTGKTRVTPGRCAAALYQPDSDLTPYLQCEVLRLTVKDDVANIVVDGDLDVE